MTERWSHTATDGTNELEVVVDKDGATITVDCPWQGSTETGFGATCSIRISPEQLRELVLGMWGACR